MNVSKMTLRNATLGALITAGLTPAVQALEVTAGDYEVYPAGVNIGVLYDQHIDTGGLYVHGTKVASDFDVTLDVGLLRYIRPTAVTSTITVDPQFILPFGHYNGSGSASVLGSGTQLGDLILGAPIKFLLDPTSRDAFSVGPFLYLPTGSYDRDRPFNPFAENRWKGLLQFAYVTHFSPTWALDVISDVTVYGENNKDGNSTLKQAAQYEEQAHLRYYVTPATFVAADYGYKFGGNQSVDGVSLDNRTRTQYARLTTTSFITPTWQLQGQVGADVKVENGPKDKAFVNLRLAKIF